MKTIFAFIALVGALAVGADAPEPQACPLGWSALAQRKGGSGPAVCSMPTCRPASASAHGHASKSGPNPLCNPVTGANCGTVLYWHYDYVLSGSPSGACPSDVVAGPWSTSAN